MAQENNIAQQLNDLLVTRDFHPDMRDAQGKVCDSSEAKVFTFDYVSGAGKDYGTMVIILDSGNDLKAMFGNNLGRGMEDADKDEWYEFQQQLSQFANSHRWTYTGDDISKLKYTMQGLAAIKEGLFEGYYGTRRISYAGEPTQARLMIRHNRNLGENDARFRYVESIFVETADGERHRLPFTNLAGGRAMLEHVRQGGKPYDVRGNHICEMITELKVLARFNRASQGRVVEGVKQSVVEGAQTYYKSLRENIKRLSSPRGYTAYFESWHPASITEQDQLVEDIKTLFVEQTIDDRIEQALPLLAKIQQGREMKEAEIFENWVNNVTEGTWSLPETPEQMTKLKELMSGELIVGPDGTNATEQLYDLIGDDVLFDRIDALAAQDPRANVWDDTDVQARLQELGVQMPDNSAPDMAAQPQPQQTQGVAEADNIAAFESLQRMRHLSGMKLEEARIEESSEYTYEKIGQTLAQQQPHLDVNSDQFRHAVYNEMIDMGMTPKSANYTLNYDEDFLGDVANSFHHYVRHQPDGQTVGQVMSQVGTRGLSGRPAPLTECNYTMEGEYCPEHGLSECWSQGMYEDILSTGIQLAEDDKTNEGFRDRVLQTIFKTEPKIARSSMDNLGTVSKSPNALLAPARSKEAADMQAFNKLYPEIPLTPASDEDLLKSFNHHLNVKKDFGQANRESMPNDFLPTGAARAVRTQGAAFDAEKSMQSNQDRIKNAYGIDEDMTDVGDVVGQATRSAHDWLGQEANNIYKPIGNFIKGVKQGWNGKAQTDIPQTGAAVARPVQSPDITTRELPGEPRQTGFDRRVKQPKTDPDTPVRSDDDLDEASYMDPQVVDLTSDNEIARAHELLKQYTNGKADFAANNRQLLARMTGQDKTGAAPGSVAPSFGTPGAAHAGQGGSDYQDEEPKGQAHAGQGGYNYSDEAEPNDRRMNDADWIMSQNLEEPKGQAHSGQQGYDYQDEPDQSDAETSRLNRAGKSVDLGLPPGQLDKNAWDDMMKSVPGLDKNAWADLMRGNVSEADRAQGFTAPGFDSRRWSPVGRRGSAGLGPDGQPAPLKNTSADVTKDPLFRAAMNRIDADNKGNSRSRYFLPHSDEPVVQPPRVGPQPDTDIPDSDGPYPVSYSNRDDLGPPVTPVFDQEPLLRSLDNAPRLPNNTVTNVDVTRESREGDALLARIKSLALIR